MNKTLIFIHETLPYKTVNMKSELENLSEFKNIFGRKELFFSVIVAAILLRLFGLGSHSLWIDEAGTASLVETFIETGIPQYPSGKESFRSMPHLIVTSVSVIIFGLNDFALRIPSLIFGVMTIILVFKWAIEVFEYKTALLSSSILAFSSWHIAMSQNARMYAMFQFLYLSTFYMAYTYIETKDVLKILYLSVLTFLSIQTHITGYILIFTLPLYILTISESDMIQKITIISAFLLFLNVGLENLSWKIMDIFEELTFYFATLVEHLQWFGFNLPINFFLGVSGGLIGLYKNVHIFKNFLFAVVPPTVVYMFFIELPASRYLFFSLPFLAMGTSYFVKFICETFMDNELNTYLKLSILIIVIILSLGNPLNPQLGSAAPEADFKSAYHYLGERSSQDELLIVGRSLPADHYFEKPDYVLEERTRSKEYTVNGRDEYSNSTLIGDQENLTRITKKNKRGWIVATDIVQRGIRPELMNEIEKFELKWEGDNIDVWRWNRK